MTVTSRGCSRSFIICVCYRALYNASLKFACGQAVNFPFDEEDVKQWLVLGRFDCEGAIFQAQLGGTAISHSDIRTFWTEPQQFFTWWKNNIERKKKHETLISDSDYRGFDLKLSQR